MSFLQIYLEQLQARCFVLLLASRRGRASLVPVMILNAACCWRVCSVTKICLCALCGLVEMRFYVSS